MVKSVMHSLRQTVHLWSSVAETYVSFCKELNLYSYRIFFTAAKYFMCFNYWLILPSSTFISISFSYDSKSLNSFLGDFSSFQGNLSKNRLIKPLRYKDSGVSRDIDCVVHRKLSKESVAPEVSLREQTCFVCSLYDKWLLRLIQ